MIPDCLFTRKVPNFRVLYPNRIIGVGPTKRQTAWSRTSVTAPPAIPTRESTLARKGLAGPAAAHLLFNGQTTLPAAPALLVDTADPPLWCGEATLGVVSRSPPLGP